MVLIGMYFPALTVIIGDVKLSRMKAGKTLIKLCLLSRKTARGVYIEIQSKHPLW